MTLAPTAPAPQHRPRPLPLFLDMLRRETAGSPERMVAALAGLRRYQQAIRPPPPPALPVIAAAGRARLHDYGGDGPTVVFVPSLINPPSVLDLVPGPSLLRWLATQRLRPLLVDWGTPAPAEAALDVAGHVESLLLPLLDTLAEPPLLAGYCLGGTIALAAATVRPVRALALIATPWHFDAFPAAARTTLATLWRNSEATATALGLLPMEVLQTLFWSLDPARTIAKFETFAGRAGDDPALPGFVALEDWSSDGAPLTLAAGRQLFEDFFAADLTGRGGWRVGGRTIDPAALGCPLLDIVSTRDRIVPAASAAGVGRRLALALGHVGMIVGKSAPDQLWAPLRDWLLQPGH